MESQQILCEIFIFLPEFYSAFMCFFDCGLFCGFLPILRAVWSLFW